MEDQLMANAPAGQATIQKMIDDGVNPQAAQQWGAQQRQNMLTDGLDPAKVDEYWGGKEPNMSAAQGLLKQGMDTVPPEKAPEVASDPWGMLKAGFQNSDIGLMMGKPTEVAGSDPGLLGKIMQGLGQGVGDLPVMIAGGALGGAAGEAAMPAGGGIVGAGAGASALPEAWRQVLMDHYASHEGPFTWRDFMGRVGSMVFETGKAALAGAIGGKVAGGVEAAIAKTTLGEGVAKVAGIQAFGVAAAAAGATMNGQIPDAEDFAAGAVLGLGFAAAGAVKGATQRFVATDSGAVVQENMRENYARNGADPVQLGHMAAVDPVVLSEVMAPHGPDGEPMTPVLDAMKHPDPDPPHPPKAIEGEETPSEPKPLALAAPVDTPEDHESRALTIQGDKEADYLENPVALAEGGESGKPPAIPPEDGAGGEPGGPFPLNEDMIDSRILDVIGEKAPMQQKFWLRRLVGMFQGQLEGARQLEEELGGVDKGQVGIVDMLRSVFGSRDRAGRMIRFGGWDAITQKPTDTPSVLDAYKAVREDGGTLDGYVAYRLAKRAVRLAGEGREPGVDLDMAQAKMALDNTKYERGDRIMQDAKNGVIKYGVNSGLFSQAQADAMMATDDHIMFRRIMDPTYAGPKLNRTFRTKMPVKRFEGSNRLIENPIVADLDNIHTIVAMADRNRAAVSIMNWIDARNEQARVVGREEAGRLSRVEAIDAKGQSIETELQDANGNPIPDAASTYEPFIAWRKNSAGLGPNDFIIYREGQGQIIHTTNPDLAALMRLNIGGEAKNVVVRALEGMAAFSRAGITASLDFPFRSLTHGQLARAAFAEHGSWVPYSDFIGNVMEVWNQGERFQKFMGSGAGGAALTDMDTNYISRDIGKIFDETGVDKSLWGVVTTPFEAIRKLQLAVDTAARMGHMERMENKGYSTLKAAMSSRTAYLDHAEGFASSAVNAFARMVPFFSIGLKDLEQVGAAMKRDPLMFAARGVATLTSLSVLNFTANHIADQMIQANPNLTDAEKEAQLYTNLPRWERDMYWVMPAVNGVRVKIKKPYVGAMLFNVMPERFMEWAATNDPKPFKDWASATAAQMIPPFMPSLMQPIVENVANRSTFNWRPVIKGALEQRSGYMQYTQDTTAPAKAISKLLGPPGLNVADTSPAWIDQYVREWGGTLPFTVLKTLGQAWEPNMRPWDITQLPFVGSFFARNPGMGADSISDFYDKLDTFKRSHADLRAAMQEGDFSRIAPSDLLRGAMSATGLEKSLRGITQAINAIDRDKAMTDVEKRQRIDSLTGTASLAAKAGTRMLEQADKSARNASPMEPNDAQ